MLETIVYLVIPAALFISIGGYLIGKATRKNLGIFLMVVGLALLPVILITMSDLPNGLP